MEYEKPLLEIVEVKSEGVAFINDGGIDLPLDSFE